MSRAVTVAVITAMVLITAAHAETPADNHHAVAIGNTKWQSDGFASATDAYTIEVNGGACNVTVDTSVPAA